MPKSRRSKIVADFEASAAAILRRGRRSVLAKGNAISRRQGASPTASPRVNPALAYAGPKAPLPEAYGPPIEDFRGEIPEPIGAVSQGATALDSLAPRPVVDKFPVVIGAGLSFAYLAAVQRTALVGYRMQYVDLMREILERDPHLYAVVSKVVLGVANGRLEITPAELPEGHPDEERAKAIAADVERRVRRIRGLQQSIATLGWGAYYGVSCAELHYKREADGSWIVDRLGFVHSRRLSYPDMGTWDLYIWDQGQVLSASPYGTSPTNSNMFGLRVADYPQKFIVFAPQMSGDYPTREGIARIVAEWALSKRLNARVALAYLERFVNPWPESTYNTADPDDEHPGPRPASDEDVAQASAAMTMLGAGALSSWTHPDSVKVELKSPDNGKSKLTFKEFLEICNEEESKGAIGSTLTTSGGQHGGNRALGETHKAEEQNVVSFYASIMSGDFHEQVMTPLTLLNHDDAQHLVPQCKIHVDDKDPTTLLRLAAEAAKSNIPVDADEIANEIGLPVVPKPDGVEFRRMLPLDVTAPADLEPGLTPEPGPGTAGGAKLESEKTKAAQPPVMPGLPGAVPPKPDTAPDTTPKDATP